MLTTLIPDWKHLVSAAIGAGLFATIRVLVFGVVRQRATALMRRYWMVKMASRLGRERIYSGRWEIVWEVESENFARVNRSNVELFKFFRFIAAVGEFRTKQGHIVRYGFVGQLRGDILTGEWADREGATAAYYGPFQIVVNPTLRWAAGKWAGFAEDRSVKSDNLTWRKI